MAVKVKSLQRLKWIRRFLLGLHPPSVDTYTIINLTKKGNNNDNKKKKAVAVEKIPMKI